MAHSNWPSVMVSRNYSTGNLIQPPKISFIMKTETSTAVALLKQEPVIIYDRIKAIGEEVGIRIAALNIEGQVANEDTVKSLKKLRADLRKENQEYEAQRKGIKEAITKPYAEFEGVYKENILVLFKNADAQLQEKILQVEDGIRQQRHDTLEVYFNELSEMHKLDFVKFEQVRPNITLSASLKKLKEEVGTKVDEIVDALGVIETQVYPVEILAEYKATLNLTHSIKTVTSRKEEEARILEQKEAQKAREAEFKAAEPEPTKEVAPTPEVLQAPVVEQSAPKEEVHEATFTVKGTLTQLEALKQFIESNNIEIL